MKRMKSRADSFRNSLNAELIDSQIAWFERCGITFKTARP